VPAARVQVAELKVPVELVVNVTVPVGVTAPVPEASATVAEQLAAVLSATLAGEHETVVVVERIVDATVKVPLLPVWTLSPP
jgi:phenylpyruvate tautomerase PptA (4-oxalocrotonate tautomerase family)